MFQKQALRFAVLAIWAKLCLAQQTCGRSSYPDAGTCDLEGNSCESRKIVGGVEARLHELPYQVNVQYYESFFCGGILIGDNIVLTAAHCTAGDPAEDHSVAIGEHDMSVTEEDTIVIGCQEIIEHEDYNPRTLENDIAIMILAENVSGKCINPDSCIPVCFDSTIGGDNIYGLNSVISGWGNLESGGPGPDVLQYANVPVMPYDECEECFGPDEIYKGMLCAGYCESNDKDTCQGDSGGPLAVKVDDEFHIAGITSWGYGCADTTPGVYTDIHFFEPWIRDNLP